MNNDDKPFFFNVHKFLLKENTKTHYQDGKKSGCHLYSRFDDIFILALLSIESLLRRAGNRTIGMHFCLP